MMMNLMGKILMTKKKKKKGEARALRDGCMQRAFPQYGK